MLRGFDIGHVIKVVRGGLLIAKQPYTLSRGLGSTNVSARPTVAPDSVTAVSPWISSSLLTSNLGFRKTLTLRM